MERRNLINARKEKGLRQADFAKAMGVNRTTVSAWENATQDPHPDLWPKIRGILDSNDPELFKVFDDQQSNERLFNTCRPLLQEPNGGLLDAFRSLLQKSNEELIDVFQLVLQQELYEEFMDRIRRLIVDTLAKLGGSSLLLGSANLSVLSSPIIAPEEYLAQCRVTTAACWEWLNQGRFHKVESVLSTLTPTLARFANTLSPYQNIAATLAVEARIMQAFLATQQLDYATREILCVDAVRFGELSGNRRIHTVALEWYGATYTNCYHQPQKAIPIFEQALSGLDSDAWLSKAHISIDLAMAYAQDKDETKSKENETIARDYMEIARLALPKHPELDAFFSHIGLGHSELDQFEGQVYLHLAERFPNSGYAQLAYDAFEKSTSKQAMSKSYSGQALIRRADATRALGDMDEFVKCLTNGLLIAIEMNSLKRFNQAHDVMRRIPEVWQRETPIQTLQKDLSHAISGARR